MTLFSKYSKFAVLSALFFFGNNFIYSSENFSSSIQESLAEIKNQLPNLRIKTEDCAAPPLWDLPLIIPKIENLLHEPLSAPLYFSSWTTTVSQSQLSSHFLKLSKEILISTDEDRALALPTVNYDYPKFDISKSSLVKQSGLSADLINSISNIVGEIKQAVPYLKESYSNLSEEEKAAILSLHDFSTGVKVQGSALDTEFKKKTYKSMEKFNQNLLLLSAENVMKSVDRELKNISRLITYSSASISLIQDSQPVQLMTEIGKVIIGGKGNHHYSDETMKDAVLLIDLGGENSYEGSVAGAQDGKIKVVIDFGENITIISTNTVVSAGAGVFGIGLLYLPNPSGTKTIITGSFAQGTGLCGVGGLFVNGPGNFKGERYVQGIGIFGAGIFSSRLGNNSAYEVRLYGQGVGFTRGVGIFRYDGSSATFRGGLVDPDPRESLGTTSLCQGVGYGPRGYAGGGLGLCVLNGNQLSLESSYFAQGAGYWRGAGVFSIQGNSNFVKARRYDQGSGIHSAIGSFFLHGDNNHVVNWGVGPAFGWDNGIGWTIFQGNENKVQAEWGAGTASIASARSFSVFKGNKFRLDLPGLAGAQFNRDIPDYAVSVIEGKENMLKRSIQTSSTANGQIFVSPWGSINFQNVQLTNDVGLPKSEWARLPREEAIQKETINLVDEIKQSETLLGKEKIEKLLRVASAFTIDKINPRIALAHLLTLKENEIQSLIKSLDPADVEGFIQIRIAAGIFGETAADAILNEIENENGKRLAFLLSLLAFAKAETATPTLLKMLNHPDWRIQATAIRVLGFIFNQDYGSSYGRMYVLNNFEKWLNSNWNVQRKKQKLSRELAGRTFAEACSILSLSGRRTVADRLFFLQSAPEDINSNLEEEKAIKLLSYVREQRKESLQNIRQELKSSYVLRETVRTKLLLILDQIIDQSPSFFFRTSGHPERSEGSTEYPSVTMPPQDKRPQNTVSPQIIKDKQKSFPKELIHSVIVALGNIGNEQDAEKISKFLSHESALVREGASAALGRIGKHSLKFLEKEFDSSNITIKIHALLSVTQTSDPALLPILEKGLRDKNAQVQKTALSAIEQLTPAFSKQQQQLRKKIKTLNPQNLSDDILLQKRFLYGN